MKPTLFTVGALLGLFACSSDTDGGQAAGAGGPTPSMGTAATPSTGPVVAPTPGPVAAPPPPGPVAAPPPPGPVAAPPPPPGATEPPVLPPTNGGGDMGGGDMGGGDMGGGDMGGGDMGGDPPTTGAKAPTIPAVTAQCPTFQDGNITFMGLRGITVVAGPKAPGATAPMVFYWHGTGSVAGEFNGMATAVRDGVVAEGGVLISFQGSTGGDFLSGTSVFGRGDFELVDQLAACAVQDHNVDPRRIFTTGCSAGGLFAAALASNRSSYIAAAAPNSGGFAIAGFATFENDYTPALMTMHGAPGRDVVVIDFSNSSATADRIFSDRGGFVINCNHGGGHCGAAALAPSVWEFFTAHPYGVEPSPTPWTSLPGGFHESCEIYGG